MWEANDFDYHDIKSKYMNFFTIKKGKYDSFKQTAKIIAVLFTFLLLPYISGAANVRGTAVKEDNTFLSYLQTQRITLEVKNKTLEVVLKEICKQSEISYVVKGGTHLDTQTRYDFAVNNETVERSLDKLLSPTNYSYLLENGLVQITAKPVVVRTVQQQSEEVELKGKVVDKNGKPVVGTTVIAATGEGTITDGKGAYILVVKRGVTVEFSSVGYVSYEYVADKSNENLIVTLEEDELAVEDVVVTGIYKRDVSSFTGSATTYSAQKLKEVGNTNVLQSLKTLDPAFIMLDDKDYGSDPNNIPSIQLRGATSVAGLEDEYGSSNVNTPLFIIDGVEATIQNVIRLNMDRVASITILKDAASTAIYGSRAANGVIVIETIQPLPGELRVSYSGNMIVQMPDLSDYNLMNAAEKLEFERVAGVYSVDDFSDVLGQYQANNDYYEKYKEILRGVDTYWLSYPLRTAVSQSHNLYIDGGDNAMRYGLGVNYNNTQGVMKQSGNNTLGANLDLSYRKKNLIFTNKFSMSVTNTEREPVSFSEFAKQNPYYRPYDENGDIVKYLYYNSSSVIWENIINPLYTMQWENTDKDKDTYFSNSFSIDWNIISGLKFSGRLNLSQTNASNTTFTSPDHPMYDGVSDNKNRGLYTFDNNSSFTYDGMTTLTFGKLFNDKHMVNAVAGWSINQSTNKSNGYYVQGFTTDKNQNPIFSAGFTEGQKPSYANTVRKSTSFFVNGNYSYDERFLVDVSYRTDGASNFGVNKLFTSTYAFGLGWNLHNEEWIKNLEVINYFKVRASIGNPGSQNYSAYQAYRTYYYDTNYYSLFGPSAVTGAYGNPNLEWQKTLDRNIGLDLEFFDGRLKFNFDYSNQYSDPQIITLIMPASTGTTSMSTNYGALSSKSCYGTLVGTLLKNKDVTWTANFNFRKTKSTYEDMGNLFESLNDSVLSNLYPGGDISGNDDFYATITGTSTFKRYYNGADINDLYAVRSAGIDPATGMELFYTKDGDITFDSKVEDEVLIGNSTPDLEGVIGTSFRYKRLNFSLNFRYSLGGDEMASALYQKVEGLSIYDLNYNADLRALTDRWQKQGDETKFASIVNYSSYYAQPMSSRYLVEENTLSLESLSVSYEANVAKLEKYGVSGLTVTGYTNNLFRISSLKEERGLEYPFARSFNLSLSVRF